MNEEELRRILNEQEAKLYESDSIEEALKRVRTFEDKLDSIYDTDIEIFFEYRNLAEDFRVVLNDILDELNGEVTLSDYLKKTYGKRSR